MVTRKICFASNFSVLQVYQQFPHALHSKKKPSAILVCCIAVLSNFEDRLRNMSGDNCNNSGGGGGSTSLTTARYQLAEHRYGREEMLILFDRNCKPPEPLTSFSSLYVEKTQLPLALIQMTEDETRMWNGGITNIGSRGRGGSVDRGVRGRNGRGNLYSSHYSRGVGFDESGDGPRIDSQPFQARNRPFDRSQSERGWSERNGATDPGEWNGSTSPRKELNRGASGSSLMEGNWRRHRGGAEDDDGWRKWGRSSWREGGSMDRDRLDRNEDGEETRNSGGRWEHRGTHRTTHDSSHHPPPRTARIWESNHHDNNHDNLPEWATENPSESGGSFDASGAFHGGMYSDDDEDGVISAGGTQETRTRRVSEGSATNTTRSGSKPLAYSSTQAQTANRNANNETSTINKERSKSLHPLDNKDESVEKKRSNSPVKPSNVTTVNTPIKTSSSTSSDTPQNKSTVATSTEQTEVKKIPPANSENNKSPDKTQNKGDEVETKVDPIITIKKQVSLQTEPQKPTHSLEMDNTRKKTEDDFDRMKEEADALVAKLMADEENHREKTTSVPPSIGNQPSTVSSTNGQEKWFYRDPQGEVQGPFLASEMAEWCKAGYFTAGLMVRRTCDERYTTLGDLMKMCGRIPFTPGPPIPPLKLTDQVIPPVPNTVPAGIPVLPKTGIDDPLLLLQYQQMRLLQNQQLLLRQMRTSAIAKLSQSEHWATLTPMEQNQLIFQYVLQDSEISEVPISTNPFVPHLPSQASNPVMQLFTQMQQAKAQPETHLPTTPHSTTPAHPPAMDPIQQLIQQMGGMQNIPGIQQSNINSTPAATQEDNPIKSLLRQLNVNTNGHPQTSHIDTVWPQPPPQINPQFNAQNWLAQVGPIPAVPPGQLPTSLWDLHTKEIKTEQQILEEQNLRLQEDRKKEELRKQEELQRQAEEENAKRKKEEQVKQAEEAKRKDEERKKKEEEKKRKDEEKRKQEEERKKKEEKKRKEEEKKREEKRKQEEEIIRKKQEEEKRRKEELKKQEEKQKREEERRKKLEEEQRKQEEERMRKEAEARKQAEAEEQARRAEQRRREAEALRKLQERSKAPWAQAPRAPAATTAPAASLAEIQRLEREKKAEEQRFQQMMQQQLAQQKATEAAQEALATDSSKRLQFKWAEKATASTKPLQVKSLAQIQQEEQERIAKVKMKSWSGSIEIGVTECDPEIIELPARATNLCQGTWIMTNSGIVHDGARTVETYGMNLNALEEGSTLGVMRTSNHELIFYINGISQDVAVSNIPERIFAVVDMYGDCVQVTITYPQIAAALCSEPKDEVEINNDYALGEASNSSTTNLVANLNVNLNVNVNVNLPKNTNPAAIREDRLRFHERVGSLVKLSNNARTAERRRPLDEFNNGVVMTHRPLRDNELFEVRIDRLLHKWSGSIEVGVTMHSPTALEFPATMTNMRSGTTMMSGCGILVNGKGTCREYGEFNLDELREGDRVGMIRRSNGNLHYLINGLDQGVAAKVPAGVWGVIDLYGMTVKVTIVDRDEREEQNLVTRRNTLQLQGLNETEEEPPDRLMFHSCCGTHVEVINNGRTAHRPNVMDDFNNGVVLTSRPLKPNELFEVRLDKIVTKWAGSIEIGVTTHSPTELEFPFTMTNVRSGTWMMTENGVMHNGTTIIDQYGQNLDRLQVGDRVGVMRKDNATLHFYVNGADQGAAAMNVPERVYGVIDLYGQAAQATIVDNTDFYSPTTNNSSFSNTTLYSDLRFHHIHGKNAKIINNGLTALRPRALGEFNEAIVIANRPLRDGEMFEVTIDKMVVRWTGAIEAGVTLIRPDELEFPSTMTDIDHDTWMLSGSNVMRDGVTLTNNYACDLDKLVEGNRIGMMRCSDSSLHYYLDGVDQGPACTGLPPHVYPVIDLYGQCVQVTIVLPERRDPMTQQYLPSENSTSQQPTSVIQLQAQTEIMHKFHESVGLNIQLNSDRTVATRCREYSNAVLLSETPLENNESFEITIQEVAREWSGCLKIGVISNESGNWLTSMNLVPGIGSIPQDAWYLTGNEVRHNGYVLCMNYCPSLEWLRVGDKIGMKRTHEGNLKFYINGEDMGIAASNIPEMVYGVIELFGSTVAVNITSSKQQNTAVSPNASLRLQDSLELLLDPMPPVLRNDAGMDTSADVSEGKLVNDVTLTPTQSTPHLVGESDWSYEFHENHGRNIQLETKTIARRVASYNQGVVMSSRPLIKGKPFLVKIEKLNERWVSNILCGVTCISPEKANFPLTALGFKKHSWIICSDWISHNGIRVKTKYGAALENLQSNSVVGLFIDEDNRLRLIINSVDQGVAATDLPPYVYAVFDLYGQCEQISIIGNNAEAFSSSSIDNTVTSVECIRTKLEDTENSREKADLECHEKENIVVATSSDLSSSTSPSVPSQCGSNVKNDDIVEYPACNNDNAHLMNNIENKTMPNNSDSNNLESSSSVSHDTTRSIKNKNYDISNQLNNSTISNSQSENSNNRNECTNVEINNATNINIKNGTANSTNNITNSNTNANNVINESIASNSQGNNLNATHQNNTSINMLSSSQNTLSNTTSDISNTVSSNFNEMRSNMPRSNTVSVNNSIGGNTTISGQNTASIHNAPSLQLLQITSLPSTPLVTNTVPSKKCEYLKACMRLKKSLVLPDEFFSLEDVLCYCSACYKVEGDSAICKKGEPPAEFAVPIGWTRFPLKQNINANQIPQSTTDKWHVAFYGIRLDAIRLILDTGELMTKEQLDVSNLTMNIKAEDQNPQVTFSPSIKYAASEEFTRKYPLKKSRKISEIEV
nr:PREDICTED: uncharacterized protein LOC100874771 isoform X5 [Megachile rotundata]